MGWGSQEPTRSHLERSFLRLLPTYPRAAVARRSTPRVSPCANCHFLWRPQNASIAEVDGYAYHSSRASYESDRPRDRELQRRGYVVLRFTYREVTEEAETRLRRNSRAQLQR